MSYAFDLNLVPDHYFSFAPYLVEEGRKGLDVEVWPLWPAMDMEKLVVVRHCVNKRGFYHT